MAQITNSILHDTKQMLGQEFDDDTFDLDIKNHINTVFFNLNQIGVGPSDGFEITDATTLWSAYIGATKNLNAVKSYIYIRVRLMFDPPTNGFLVTSLEKQADKLEWTLSVEVEPYTNLPAPIVP
jgi:hypothetical protein